MYIDQVDWQQPVRLDFGAQGAAFRGVGGRWRYRLANVPDDAVLYDVTDQMNPAILGRTSGNEHIFEDGPEPHDYVLAAGGTVFAPRLQAHTPIAITAIDRADVVYIAPKEFHDELQPLLDLRRSAGLIAEAVDVQEVYDGWGYGFVDPVGDSRLPALGRGRMAEAAHRCRIGRRRHARSERIPGVRQSEPYPAVSGGRGPVDSRHALRELLRPA